MNTPKFIAHRGYARHYPENTLIGIEAAMTAGAKFIEIDVQLTADRIPVLFHDDDLYRVTGETGNINEIDYAELKRFRAAEITKFNDRYPNERIPSLAEFVELTHQWPDVTSFVEIKTESLERFGIENVAHIVMNTLSPNKSRCIPISYSDAVLRCARNSGASAIGWILKDYDNKSQDIASNLLPDYLFCNYKKLPPPPTALWSGPWSCRPPAPQRE